MLQRFINVRIKLMGGWRILKTKGIGTPVAIAIVVIALTVVGASICLALPKEQIIIDTTTFVSEERHYPAELKAGQVVHVYIKVISGGPVEVDVLKGDQIEIWESNEIYTQTSHDLEILSTGPYTFYIINWGDGLAQVKIKVTISSG